MSRIYFIAPALAGIALFANAQSISRRASITGGGDRDRGKCTIEIVVDSVAEVEVRGDSAVLRTLGGQPAEWRRFQCNTPMPQNPIGFRFSGIDGRGRQTLLRSPGGNSPAVVRIEDPQGGREGYTFDLEWRYGAPEPPPIRSDDRDRDRPSRRFTTEEAINRGQTFRRPARSSYPHHSHRRRRIASQRPGPPDMLRRDRCWPKTCAGGCGCETERLVRTLLVRRSGAGWKLRVRGDGRLSLDNAHSLRPQE